MAGEARILFEGAAGTGKTLLAVEEARRAHSREERTLVLCFNRLLGDFLRGELGDSGSHIGTLHSFIAQTKTLSTFSFPSSTEDFDQLTRIVREANTFVDNFDTIIIDEVQDFCSIGADQLVAEIIEQNRKAKIRMFGDFENQAINFGSVISRQDFLNQFSNFQNYRLTRNCRNRPGIGGAIEIYTQKSDLYLGFRLPETSNNLRTVVADSHIDLLKQCESEFLRLSKTYLPSEIVILGLTGEISTNEVSDKFSPALTNDHIKWSNGSSKVLSTTVRKFKGLEAQAVILTNLPDETDIDLMYTGMSRAIEEIVIIAPRVVLARFIGIQS
jgi:superfamily I DNA/RNA helicase